jgi:diguanylate cyclase (GGDEF)-like protein
MNKLSLLALLLLSAFSLRAEQSLQDLISEIQANNYDCLTQEQVERLDRHLASDGLTAQQDFYLKVRKAQYQACAGKYEQASEILNTLLSQPVTEDESENHAYALFLAGVVTDPDNKQQRCDYYRRAGREALRVGSESIHLGAQLELTSACDIGDDKIEQSLSTLYMLLEKYSGAQNKATRSDIFNNIGNLYRLLGQHELAAEQYYKSYQMSLGIYEGETLMLPLFNAARTYLNSAQVERTEEVIQELIRKNIDINTPLSNAWLNQAQAYLAEKQKNWQALEESLLRWSVFLPELSMPEMEQEYRRLSTRLCLHRGDLNCVSAYLDTELDIRPMHQSNDLLYLKLLVESFYALELPDRAQQAFGHYVRAAEQALEKQQAASRILGVARMMTDIVELESSLAQVQQQKSMTTMKVVIVLILTVLVLLILLFMFYRRHKGLAQIDELTGMLNRRATLDKLKALPRPSPTRAHALALFELNQLDEINAMHGQGTGDKALQQIAAELKSATRHGDVVGRVGVNEFMVCLSDIDELQARKQIERITQSIRSQGIHISQGQTLNLKPTNALMIVDDALNDAQALYQSLTQAAAQTRS